jgi:formylglycine-generating enzyme required for sulfatase activity
MHKKQMIPICIFVGFLLTSCGGADQEALATDTDLPPTPSQTPPPTLTPTPKPQPELGSVLLSEADGMKMVFIPGGIFQMGSTDEEIDLALEECQTFWDGCTRDFFEDEVPGHEVNLDPYWLDQTEVTVAMYLECAAAGECIAPAVDGYYYYAGYLSDPLYQKNPVVFVNWQDARTYCAWAGRRLPTEAEWELAARGPEGRKYPWGSAPVNGNLLNFRDVNFGGEYIILTADDGYKRLAPVGSYPDGASYYGVLDLAGNVWEWVDDWYQVYPGGDETASVAFGQSERVIRGGDFASLFPEHRTAYRYSAPPEDTFSSGIGFRCALTNSEEIADLYTAQQMASPQPTLAPVPTANPAVAGEQDIITPEEACKFIEIKAYPGNMAFFSDEELPAFGYSAGGFIPEELITVKLSGLTQAAGLSYTMDVADFVRANGKGLVDGILVWSESGILGASIPNKLAISLEGDSCSLSQDLSWPYDQAGTTSEPEEAEPTSAPAVAEPTSTPEASSPMTSASFRDDFNSSMDPGWAWIRAEDGQWDLVSISGSGYLEVSLTSAAQVDMEGPETLLLRWIEGQNFELITRMLFQPTRNYQRVGLVIYENRDNYVALVRGYANDDPLPGNALYLENKIESQASFWNFGQKVSSPFHIYLKLRREGDLYTGFYSTDGETWETLGELEVPMEPVSYGFLIGKSDAGITADIDFIEFIPLP